MSRICISVALGWLLAADAMSTEPLGAIDAREFQLVVTADPQVGPASTTNPNLRGPNNRLRQFVDVMNASEPDGVVFAGDLTFGGDADSVKNFVDTLESLDAPTLVVRGEVDRGRDYEEQMVELERGQKGYADLRIGDWRALVVPPPCPQVAERLRTPLHSG